MKTNKYLSKIILLAFITTFFFSSCATILTGTKDSITFNSNPQGATVFIDGLEQCKTPCTLDVKRNFNNTYVEFKLDSYETKIITLSKEFNTMSIFNLTNMVGWGIDFITGAVMKYDRKAYDINFDNKKTAIFYPTRINIDTKKNCVELYVIAN